MIDIDLADQRRNYRRITPEKMARLRDWYRQKLVIGTNKTIAKELGVSPGRIEQLLAVVRDDVLNELGMPTNYGLRPRQSTRE